MLKNILPMAAAVAALSAAAVAQTGTQVVIPPHNNIYNGFSRGYGFAAGGDFFIQDFELPIDAMLAGDTAGVFVRINGVNVFSSIGNAGAIMTPPAPIQVFNGDYVDVVGNWSPVTTGNFTAHNSYGLTAPFATTIEGVATNLDRVGVQWDIGDPVGGATGPYLAPTTGSIGRVWMYTTPPAGIFASFNATPSTGSSPLTVTFTDTTFTDDPAGVQAWAWDFDGDGVIDSTNSTDTFVYPACGSYDVTLTATDIINGSSTTTVVGAVEVDNVVASFTVAELAPGTGLWLFTDTSAPTPISWDWDFDGDGIIDDTTQNPVYFDPGMSGLLSLPNCTLTVGGQGGCFSNTITQNVQATGYGVVEVLTGGNGTVGTPSVGTYFNVTVGAEGVNITDLNTGVYGFAGGMDVSVFITSGGHAGKEGNINAWTLASSGSGIATGTGTVAVPEMVPITLNNSFYLPANSTYGIAVVHTDQAGGSMQISYTTGPGNAPYGNSDLTIHPLDPTTGAPTGCSMTSFMGPCVFQPRLWNGRLIYSTCSVSQAAAGGSYAAGCVNSAGVVPSLTVTGPPQIGANLSLEVDSGLAAPAAVLIAFGTSKDVYNGLPLPLDLGALGAPGCELATSIIVTDLLIANPGANPYSLALPNNPAYMCQVFYQQAAVLDVGVNALGFVLSNATATSLGN